jgi:hypothetical protein
MVVIFQNFFFLIMSEEIGATVLEDLDLIFFRNAGAPTRVLRSISIGSGILIKLCFLPFAPSHVYYIYDPWAMQ